MESLMQTKDLAGFEISYQVEEDKEFWFLSTSIKERQDKCILRGQDVELQLLDENMIPLEKISKDEDYGLLSSLDWLETVTYFKDAEFALGVVPQFLFVKIFNDSDIFPIPYDEEYQEKQTIDISDPKELMPKAKGVTCCVDNFMTPDNPLVNQRPGIVLAANGFPAIKLYPKRFEIEAWFTDSNSCACNRCQYRQFVKGGFYYTKPGKKKRSRKKVLQINPPKKPNGPNQEVVLNPNEYLEDTIPNPKRPGVIKTAFGHKPSLNSSEKYTDQECTYWCIDAPRFTGVYPKGTLVEIDIDFEGRIIDTVTQEIKEKRNWKWKQSYTF